MRKHGLPAQPPQQELTFVAWQYPCLVTVAEGRARLPRLKLCGRRRGCFAHPTDGDEPPAVERAVIREEHAESCVVRHPGGGPERRYPAATHVAEAGGGGRGPTGLPDLVRQGFGEWRLRR